MDVSTAVRLINESVTFFPGWSIRAEDFTSRHEGAICLKIEMPSFETNRPEAQAGYPVPNRPRQAFILQVHGMDDMDLHRAVIGKIVETFTHETREGYRIGPTYWAPFHPHQIDGMQRWGEPDKDLQYGFNSMSWDEASDTDVKHPQNMAYAPH